MLADIVTRPSGSTLDSDAAIATVHSSGFIRSHSHGASNKVDQFLASLPCVVYEAALDLTVRMISPNVSDLIGIQAETLYGNRMLWEERLCREDRGRLFARMDRLSLAEIASENHRIIDDQGLLVWVSHSFRKVSKNGDTCIRGCITPMSRDACARSLDSGVISQFVHKIGNHFQLINLLIGSLKRSGASTDEIDTLQETVDRAVEFTRSFSNYSQTPVYLSAVDLSEILRSVIHTTVPLFSEKNILFKALVHESLNGALIHGDPFLLELALGSILQNAVDATTSAEQIVVEAKREIMTSSRRSIARVTIADTGCGMDTGVLAKATAPFFSSKPGRDGLGLTVAIRIIELHGGLLNISSEVGHGTRVEILLPVSESVERSER